MHVDSHDPRLPAKVGLEDEIVGVWVDCPDPTKGYQPILPTGFDGIEFTTDGHWYYIRLVDGQPVRASDPGANGTYFFRITSPGAPPTELIMQGRSQMTPIFMNAPEKVLFWGYDGSSQTPTSRSIFSKM